MAKTYSVALKEIFRIPNIVSAWKKSVRTGARSQVLLDVHDYLDVHRNINEVAKTLRLAVINGHYSPSAPEYVLVEKSNGLTRRLMVPRAIDAVALQTVVDQLEKKILRKRPTNKAFYSRSHFPVGVEAFNAETGYPWPQLWPKFQREIFQFSSKCRYTVVTDIANYFDCIPLATLRRKVSSMSRFDEHSLNFLFFLLESFQWRPEYIPSSGTGLPQINYDAPRLLAHGFLFEIDQHLNGQTNGNFVRWMDDIDFGVNKLSTARRVLQSLDTKLSVLGVRLNTGKTKILSSDDASRFFWLYENRIINTLTERLKQDRYAPKTVSRVVAIIQWRFTKFFNVAPRIGHWEKVLKRYINLHASLNSTFIEPFVQEIFVEHPSARSSILRYLTKTGFSISRADMLLLFLDHTFFHDDEVTFGITNVLLEWRVPKKSIVRKQIVEKAKVIASSRPHTRSKVLSGLLLCAKYGTGRQLNAYVSTTEESWKHSEILSRQIAGITPLLGTAERQKVLGRLSRLPFRESVSVLISLRQISNVSSFSLDKQLQSYVQHSPKGGFNYGVQRFIIAKAVLNGSMLAADKIAFKTFLSNTLSDPVYRERLL